MARKPTEYHASRQAKWKIAVENFGRIGSAEIAAAPLLLLLGRNNTGKSYIASLMWAAGEVGRLLVSDRARADRPDWLADFIRRPSALGQASNLVLDRERAKEILLYLNGILSRQTAKFMSTVFAYEGFKQSKFQIQSDCFEPTTFGLEWRTMKDGNNTSSFLIINFEKEDVKNTLAEVPVEADLLPDFIGDFLARAVVFNVLFGTPYGLRGEYIPAGRTGLMLAYSSIVSDLFERLPKGEGKSETNFSLPTSRFLQTIIRRTQVRGNKPYAEIADWLERELMSGKIIATGGADTAPVIRYHVSDDVQLPLHATSSMITELVPFLLVLRQGFSIGQLVFEEPEAHLHLSAQRLIARAIVRLVNAGTSVIVTSHSDTFVQQINNLMQLHQYAKKPKTLSKMGYNTEDTIDPDFVRGYEFVRNGEATTVSELKKIEEGLIVPSLNETIFDLQEETIQLQDLDNELGH